MVSLTIPAAYPGRMTPPKKPPSPARTRARAEPKAYPNRINELKAQFGYSYDEIATRLNALYDENFHSKTIGSLARGESELTYTWMQRFGRLFGVKPTEVIEKQAQDGFRMVEVEGTVAAGAWAESHVFDSQDRTYVPVPNNPDFANLTLYARKIEGQSMNLIYAEGSMVVLSRLLQRPGEIIAGKRYHVRRTRGDLTEETIKKLVRAGDGSYWLQPESNSPEFAAFPLEGANGETVELIGRVRHALTNE